MEFHSQGHIYCADGTDKGISVDGTLAYFIDDRYTELYKEGSQALIN